MSAEKEELISSFEFIGQKLTEDLIEKCLELCSKYDIIIEDFVDHWSAFSITNLKSAPISADGLVLLERKELAKLVKKANKQDSLLVTSLHETKVSITPKKQQNTLNNVGKIHNPSVDSDVQHIQSSSRELQIVEETVNSQDFYANRTNSGEIVASFGSVANVSERNQETTVKILSRSKWYTPEKFRYLQATPLKVATAFVDHIEHLGQAIMKKNQSELKHDPNWTKSKGVMYGRIRSETLERLHANTIKLERSPQNVPPQASNTVKLNISSTRKYSIFPGQIVVVHGMSSIANTFVPEKIYTTSSLEFIQEPPDLSDSLQVVIAAGPFTTSDNYEYEPLQDLLKYVTETKPNVLILLGPFIDANRKPPIATMVTFDEYFEGIVELITECVRSFGIKVILVPSPNDAHHHPIFPTPAYEVQQKYDNLICAPNPCLVNINGVVFGMTSTDILFHLTKEEISRDQAAQRMSRLASHLLNQHNFYPLYTNDTEVSIDYERLLNNCRMEVKPHVLVLPSNLRYCINEVENCLFVNPERLTKNKIGGTFLTLSVQPAKNAGSLIKNISCQIRKI